MNKWSLNAKIYFVLSIFIAASASIAYMGLAKMEEIFEATTEIVEGPVYRQTTIMQLQDIFTVQLILEKNFILASDLESKKKFSQELNSRYEEFQSKSKALMPRLLPAGQTNLADAVKEYENWWKLDKTIRDLSLQSKTAEATELSLGKSRELRIKIDGLFDQIVDRNTNTLKTLAAEAETDYSSAKNFVLFIAISSIAAGLILATYVLRKLQVSIKEVISHLTDSSNQVNSAASQIASSSEELSQAATEQASSLEETAASIEELNSMVQKNSENARRTSELSTNSASSAEKGKGVVNDMIQAISDISDSNTTIMNQIDESNHQISEIVKVIAEIGNKTKVINDIVFQTKLLSFNASVEAARAGEHGKGFAVVAEEVGNLAQMSGNAAKEISEMLEGSIHKVESIVNDTKTKIEHLVHNGKLKVETGTRIAKDCGHVLEEIVNNVNNVSQMANEIANACHEQSQGVNEITKAMNQLDQVTQTNAATSEEAASAAEELSSQSESLRSAVKTLVTTVMGANAEVEEVKAKAPVKAHAPKVAKAAEHNVIPLKPKAPAPVHHSTPVVAKKAVGQKGFQAPDENDPRFEDV